MLEVAGCVSGGVGLWYGSVLVDPRACQNGPGWCLWKLLRVFKRKGKAALRTDGLISAGMWAEERARRDGWGASLTAGAAGGGPMRGRTPANTAGPSGPVSNKKAAG